MQHIYKKCNNQQCVSKVRLISKNSKAPWKYMGPQYAQKQGSKYKPSKYGASLTSLLIGKAPI